MGLCRQDSHVNDGWQRHVAEKRHERLAELLLQFRRGFFGVEVRGGRHRRVRGHRQAGGFHGVRPQVALEVHLHVHLLPKLDGRVVAKQPAQPDQRHEEQRQRHAHNRGELRGELGLRGSPVGAFA